VYGGTGVQEEMSFVACGFICTAASKLAMGALLSLVWHPCRMHAWIPLARDGFHGPSEGSRSDGDRRSRFGCCAGEQHRRVHEEAHRHVTNT
jgi:hypothetical protein